MADPDSIDTGQTLQARANALIDASAATPPSGDARYEVTGTLGQGGMGRVLEARDRQFARVVAIKELKDAALGRDRLELEAVVTGNLEHPGVPAVHERGVRQGGVPYYVMRRVQGRTLQAAIEAAATPAARLALVPVLIRVAETIAYAHDMGVIHRDLKPQNIVLGRRGEVVVIDWGIAKVRGMPLPSGIGAAVGDGSMTAAGSVMGTPQYMAPEQARGEIGAIDERTDVFAIGAMLYHLLSGGPPYTGDSGATTLARAVEASWAPLPARAPPTLAAICRRAMATAPEARFRTAGELAEALEKTAAEALATGSRSIASLIAAGVPVALVVLLGALLAAVFAMMPSRSQQGPIALTGLVFAIAGASLSIAEWASRGRFGFWPLSLALAGCTFLIGLTSMAIGLSKTFEAITTTRTAGDEMGLWIMDGAIESMGSVISGSIMAAVQLLLWAIAYRRARAAR